MLDPELRVERSALLFLDMQNGFLGPDSPFVRSGLIPSIAAERGELISNARTIADAMRQAGRPVVYVNTTFRPDQADCYLSPPWKRSLSGYPHALVEGSESAAVLDEIKPRDGDFVIAKKGHSGFQFTALDRALASMGVDTCVVAGNVLGSMDETLRQGAAVGYENVFVADASYPLRSPHLDTLTSRTFNVTTAEVLEWIKAAERSVSKEPTVKPCLLVVDVQNDFIHPEGAQNRHRTLKITDAEREEIIQNNLKLLTLMRAKRLPVIYIKSVRGQDRFVDTASAKMALRKRAMEYRTEGSWGAEIVEEIKPQPGEYVVGKRGHSAFGTTHLHRMLRNLGVNLIIVIGGSIVGCVSDSTREAVGLGYRVVLVGNATYPPELRKMGIQALANRIDISTTEEMLKWLDKGAFERGVGKDELHARIGAETSQTA